MPAKGMTREEFIEAAKVFFKERCITLFETKGVDYEGSTMFNGIYKAANEVLISGRQAWYIMFKKHIDAIARACSGEELKSETLAERVEDSINYLLILAGMNGFFGKVSPPKKGK